MRPVSVGTAAGLASMLFGLFAAVGTSAVAANDWPLENPADGVFVHLGAQALASPDNGGDIANLGFVIGERCVAVIDSGGSASIGRALRAAIRSRTDKPVCYLIHTHVHPDHAFGDPAFAADHPVVVSHAAYPAALARRRDHYRHGIDDSLGALGAGSDSAVPSLLIDTRLTLDLGGRRLRLDAWPTAHTDHDLTVLDERTGTLFTGDMLFVDRVPIVDGKVLGWLAVIDELLALKPARVVPGHGPLNRPPAVAFAAEQAYLASLVRDCRAALRDGVSLSEAVERLDGGEQRSRWQLFDDYHRRNVTTVYTELEWEP
ncbi:quinoprotein relay system zinc metallohydrolase 2 [Nevskia sp.]|uniref:quinoprotein relay system zinc metallohydrolase 2 n=1 Tax=Nevskia sp. TaxID=1929292 RepID=UPI003F6F069A